MRILVSGDSHCDINHLKSISSKVQKFDCEKVYIVGDFGFFPSDKGGLKFLDAISDLDFPVYFLAGNHEDWEILDKHVESTEPNDEGFIEVHPNSFYAPTGHSWTWDGVKFLSVGGAYSIDRKRRVKFISWFPQEIITEEDVANCMGVGEVDVLLSHDGPACADLSLEFASQYGDMREFWIEENTELNRQRLQVIVDMTHPKYLVHGHWHLGYKQKIGDLFIQGLNCNANPDYFTVIDTDIINENRKELT